MCVCVFKFPLLVFLKICVHLKYLIHNQGFMTDDLDIYYIGHGPAKFVVVY